MDKKVENFVEMCREAYKFLEPYDKPGPGDLRCNPAGMYVQNWGKGTECAKDLSWRFDDLNEEWKEDGGPLKFRVWRQEELQQIYMKWSDQGHGETFTRLCYYNRHYNGREYQWAFSGRDGSTHALWLCFVMEKCFNRRWDMESKKWEMIKDGD